MATSTGSKTTGKSAPKQTEKQPAKRAATPGKKQPAKPVGTSVDTRTAKQAAAQQDTGPKQSTRKPAKKEPAKSAAKPAKQQTSGDERYTDPELREKLKAEIIAGDKGGKPAQWSARKAQLLTHAYEAQGGGYTHPPDAAQQSLKHWGDEHWTTSDGKPAERPGGTTRYLPEKAWEELSPEEKTATNRRKRSGSREGKQFVPNTSKAAEARRHATADQTPGKSKPATKKAGTKKAAPTDDDAKKSAPSQPATKKAGKAAADKKG